MIKAVIFDFDGVIAESVNIKTEAFAYLFKDSPKEIQNKVIKLHLDNGGMSRFEKFKIIYKDYLKQPLSEEKSKQLGDAFSDYVYQAVVNCPFVKGAKEFLDQYHKEFLFFIVSGTPEGEMKDIVNERNLNHYFKEVFGAPVKKGEHCKTILKKYDLHNTEAVFIGDAINDYIGAKEAEIPFIGRISEEEENPFIDKKVPMIRDLTELASEIKKFNL